MSASCLLPAGMVRAQTAGTLQKIPDAAHGCGPLDSLSARDATPIAPEKIAGMWNDALLGGTVTIEQKDPKDTVNFVLHGSHDWQGTYQAGQLIFTRKPTAEEMSHQALEWARKAVEGQLTWSIELDARRACGGLVLAGKWYPGRIEVEETLDASGKVIKQTAKIAGKGAPADIRYERLPPAIMGVVVLEDQTGGFAGGVAYHPYPFPGAPVPRPDPETNGSDDFNPFAFSLYSQEAEIYDANRLSQYTRAPNGRLYIPNETRTLFVYGRGLPRNWNSPLDVKGGMGATGLGYRVAALDSDKPSYKTPVDAARCEALRKGKLLLDYYEQKFALGRCAALTDVTDPVVRNMIAKADAMLVTVGFGTTTVLPGYKDFTLGNIGGDSRWMLRFGDDRALVSFGRDVQGDTDLVDYLFLPERTFIEIKTEVALPIDEIPVRVQLNDALVTWNGAETLIAKKLPADPTGRTYRTATIELVEKDKPPGPAGPGIVFLTVGPRDELMARPDDGGLLRVEDRAALVLRTPAALGMTWKEALVRAAKVAKSDVTDWDRLPNQQAGEVANLIVFYAIQKLGDNPTFNGPIVQQTTIGVTVKALALIGKAVNWASKYFGGDNRRMQGDTAVRGIPVTVGDLAALLLYRDEFVQRMTAAIDDQNGMFPSLDDAPMLRGLRKRLQPDAWNENTAWAQLTVRCPDGVTGSVTPSLYAAATVTSLNRCPFNKVLDDDFIAKAFKGDAQAADSWILAAMGEAIGEYKQASRKAIAIAKGVADSDIKGLVMLLGADCAADIGDTPCGYKALKPLLLPRMMRLVDSEDGKRKLWVPDLNARYRLRLLYTLIAAVKAQQLFSSADTAVSMAMASLIALPALSVVGEVAVAGQAADAAAGTAKASGLFLRARAIGQFAASAMSAPGANTLLTLATEIPEAYRTYRELQFAQGASLVLGQGRLSDALAKKSQFLTELVATLGFSLVQEVPGLQRLEAEARTAQILEDIEERGAAAYKQLDPADQKAFLRVAADGRILIETGNGAVLSIFDRRAAEAGEKLVVELGGAAGAQENAIARVAASGDPTPHLEAPAIAPTVEDPTLMAKTMPDNLGPSAELAETTHHPPPAPPAEPAKPATPPAETAKEPPPGGTADTVDPAAASVTVDIPAGGAEVAAPVPNYKEFLFEGATVPLELRGLPRELKLGAFVGEGQDVYAFRLANSADIRGCEDGCVIKFFVKRPSDAKEIIDRISKISEELLKAPNVPNDILQMPNISYETNNEFPYILQKEMKRSEDLITIHYKPEDVDPAKFKFSTQYFADHQELHEPLLQLYRELVDNGMAWEDGHFGNIYFQKIDGKWKAGILDQDRIIKFNLRDNQGLNFVFSNAEAGYLPYKCNSLRRSRNLLEERLKDEWARLKFARKFSELSVADQSLLDAKEYDKLFVGLRGPNFPDAEFFMEKVMEFRGLVEYRNGRYGAGFMTPEEVRKYFPKLGEPDRTAPIDIIPGALGNWWHESLLDSGRSNGLVLAFAPRRAAPMLAGEWREAA